MSGIKTLSNIVERWAGAAPGVVRAIQNASTRTGVSFDYLMNKARQESSFNPAAKAKTSSATGLFQFIDATWLQAVKTYGDQFGLGDLAAKISSDGKVADSGTRQKILSLREDPTTAANLTAAMTKDNADFLSTSLGGKVGENELYMAHFMGLGGANKFLKARMENPFQPAADLFPAAASANKNVFYDASGRKRSLDQVYDFFASKFDQNVEPVAAKPVVDTLVAVKQPTAAEAPVMIGAAGRGFVLSDDVAASQGFNVGQQAQRRMLETLLAGVDSFGVNSQPSDKVISSGNLLSPYTAMLMATLTAPRDANKTEQGAF